MADRCGTKAIFIEDDAIVALSIEDMLCEIGCEVVGSASSLQQGMDLVDSDVDIDVAVLDVNLNGQFVYPVAERLREQGVPVIFATSYLRDQLRDGFDDCALVQKPFTTHDLKRAVQNVLAAA